MEPTEMTIREDAALRESRSPIQVRWIEDPRQLEALGPKYEAFLEKIPDTRLFYRLEWIRRVWPLYEARIGPMAWLWAERGDQWIALAPLQLERKNWLRGGARILQSYGQVTGPLRHWDTRFLFAPGESHEECLAAFHDFLCESADRWDLLELKWIEDGPATHIPLERTIPGIAVCPNGLQSSLIDLSGGLEAYWETRPSKFRKDMRRCRRYLEGIGKPFTFEMTSDVPADRIEPVIALHGERQQLMRRRGVNRLSLFEDPLRRQAFLDLWAWSATEGCARNYWLLIDGRIAAYLLCFVSGSTLFPFLTSMDETFAVCSPARLLYEYLFQEEAGRHGTHWIDPGKGMNQLKKQFASRVTGYVDCRTVNPWRMASRARIGWLEAVRRARTWMTSKGTGM